MIVMPNHFHCIIENIPGAKKPDDRVKSGNHVGMPLRGHPDIGDTEYKLNNKIY